MIEHDYERSMALAERTLEMLRDHRAPATPRNYELFYNLAAGQNKKLTAAADQLTRNGEKLGADEIRNLYEIAIAPHRPESKVETVGYTLGSEIEEILKFVQQSTDSTEAFGESLKLAGAQLTRTTDPAQLKMLLKTLATATKTMASNSQELKERLADSKRQISELQTHLEVARAESYTDPLTGVANRKHFDAALAEAIHDAENDGQPLCLMMVDIDHFKMFNDNHGHQTGDGVLKLVANTMQINVKGRDLLARYGGEEFAVILPHTPLQPAAILAEQMRREIISKALIRKSTGEKLGRITLSVGIAAFKSGETAEALIGRADSCLYAAKHAGRNCIKTEADAGASRNGAYAA